MVWIVQPPPLLKIAPHPSSFIAAHKIEPFQLKHQGSGSRPWAWFAGEGQRAHPQRHTDDDAEHDVEEADGDDDVEHKVVRHAGPVARLGPAPRLQQVPQALRGGGARG